MPPVTSGPADAALAPVDASAPLSVSFAVAETLVGLGVGAAEGAGSGMWDGLRVGTGLGSRVGRLEGRRVGRDDGTGVGK